MIKELNRHDVKNYKKELLSLLNEKKNVLDVLYKFTYGGEVIMYINDSCSYSSKKEGFEYDWQHSTTIYLKEFKSHYNKLFIDVDKKTSYHLSEIYFTLLNYVFCSYNTYKTSKKMLNFYNEIISLCKEMFFIVY